MNKRKRSKVLDFAIDKDDYLVLRKLLPVGDLVNLKKLNLYSSKIAFLPSSIGKLNNLQDLDLGGTKDLEHLPEEIGDLVNVKKLNLTMSSIALLPPSIGELQNLQELHLQFGSKLSTNLPISVLDKLAYKQACVKVRWLVGFQNLNEECIQVTHKTWPFILSSAGFILNRAASSLGVYYCDEDEIINELTFKFEESDAIYQLLMDGRESFARLLMD